MQACAPWIWPEYVYTMHLQTDYLIVYRTKYKTARKTHTTQVREYATLSCTSPATYIIIYT